MIYFGQTFGRRFTGKEQPILSMTKLVAILNTRTTRETLLKERTFLTCWTYTKLGEILGHI